MKIAVVSDSHDNLATAQKALEWARKQGIATLIHCGDVCSPAMLREMAGWFSGQIHLVFGNVDGDRQAMIDFKLANVKIHGEFGETEEGGKKIAFCHKPEPARQAAAIQKYDLVFSGHTHQPWEEKIGRTRLVNPGTLAGMFNKATFAVYDTGTDKLDLILVEKLDKNSSGS